MNLRRTTQRKLFSSLLTITGGVAVGVVVTLSWMNSNSKLQHNERSPDRPLPVQEWRMTKDELQGLAGVPVDLAVDKGLEPGSPRHHVMQPPPSWDQKEERHQPSTHDSNAQSAPSPDNTGQNDVTWSWPNHIARVCDKHHVGESPENFTLEMFHDIVVDDEHKVMFCPIPKVACTTWVRIFLAMKGKLNMSEAFTVPSSKIHTMWDNLTYLKEYSKQEALHRLKTYFKFIIIRNPYERIVSAYRNKLEPGQGIFHATYNHHIVKWYRKKSSKKQDSEDDHSDIASFSEFVNYLSNHKKWIQNNHWIPFHTLCHPCVLRYDFVGNMATMERDSQHVLDKIGLGDKITFPERDHMGYHHAKSSHVKDTYFANISHSESLQLYEEYKLDFELFNLTDSDTPS